MKQWAICNLLWFAIVINKDRAFVLNMLLILFFSPRNDGNKVGQRSVQCAFVHDGKNRMALISNNQLLSFTLEQPTVHWEFVLTKE